MTIAFSDSGVAIGASSSKFFSLIYILSACTLILSLLPLRLNFTPASICTLNLVDLEVAERCINSPIKNFFFI